MEDYIRILKGTKLFSGIAEDEISLMLSCLDAHLREYRKGEYVFRQGEHISTIMMLVDGELHIQQDDYWGNRSIISHITAGEMFGEAYIAPESGALLNDVIAEEKSTVLFLDASKALRTCSSACPFHTALIDNLFCLIARKNRSLVQKISQVTRRSTREKVLSYLSDQAKRSGKDSFSIPFDRQALADYLAVDRSALSSVLSHLRNEKIIEFHKNEFKLL